MTEAEPLRLLDAAGSPVRTDATERWWEIAEALPESTLLDMHEAMVATRAFDTEAGNLQRQGKLGLWVPSIGQEGVQAGAAFALREQDTVFPSYREHLIAHVRGVRWEQIIDIFRGAAHGGWDPAETRGCRIYSLVIATHALHAAGYAMGARFDGAVGTGDDERDEAVLVCYGDGATSQGDASESLVFAQSFRAPLVTLVQNNKWAISVPSTVQSAGRFVDRARGFGVRSEWIDGNDPLVGYAMLRTLLDDARNGEGPQFVEADTYRMGAHTTSDDPTRYREDSEVELWGARDPIVRMAAYLLGRGIEERQLTEIDERARDAAADVRRTTLAGATPASDEIFDFVYRDAHPVLEAQKLALADFEATFGGDA